MKKKTDHQLRKPFLCQSRCKFLYHMFRKRKRSMAIREETALCSPCVEQVKQNY